MNNNLKISNESIKKMGINEKFYLNNIENNNLNKIYNSLNMNKHILVFGEIQSGKTQNLINYIKKITDKEIWMIIYFTGTKNNLLKQNALRFFEEFMGESLINDKYDVSISKKIDDVSLITLEENIKKNKNQIISLLKRPDEIKKIIFLLNKFKIKTLIIDDEADEATFGIKTQNKFKDLYSNENVKSISITASPFKNLYLNENFYQDYIKLSPGENYNGLKSYLNNFKEVQPYENPDDETYIIINPLISWAEKIIEKKLKNSQILFNISLYKQKHNEIKKTILFFRDQLKEYSWNKNMIKYKEAFDLIINIKDTEIIISNGDLDEKIKEYNDNHLNEGLKIIIGGANLSRGITYENLLVEVMMNSPEKPDPGVLLQRARWLGYNKNHKNIEIYTTKDIKLAYEETYRLLSFTKKYEIKNRNYKKEVSNMNFERINTKWN